MITDKLLREEFKKHNLYFIREFSFLLSPPIAEKRYKYLDIKTNENISWRVWGTDLKDIWDKLQNFRKIEIFI